jgi:methyl-accepting chemotaxis protein
MSLANRLTVRGKLLLMVAPPILGYAFFNLHDAWTDYQELGSKGLLQQGIDLSQPLWRSFVFNMAASFVVWMVTFLLVYRISLWITRPLSALAEGLKQSDLTLQLQADGRDETSQAAGAFNAYNARLRNVLQSLTGSSGSVASGATQLSASSEQMAATSSSLAQNAEAQRVAFERVAAAVTELSASIEQVSGNIRRSQKESEAAVAVRGVRQGLIN